MSKKYYRLLAVESVGNFASASEVKLIGEEAKTDFEAPKAPKVSMVKNQNTVNLSWHGATDNVGVIGYLLRKNGEDFIEFTEEASEFTVTDTVEDDVFTVEAIDEAGNISGQENTITPSAPAESDAVYEIYPTPQWVKYEEDGFAIEEVNLVYDSSIDEVTKARMEKVLKSKNDQDVEGSTYSLLQAKGKGANITYEIDREEGPAHDKTFFVHLEYNGQILGCGSGKSKKEAEQNAAKAALERGDS